MSDTEDTRSKAKKYLPETVVFLVVLTVFIMTRFIPICRVSGESMEGTLNDGELVVIDKDVVPRPGDIVVASVTFDDHSENVIKRVAAIPGDSISIKDGKLYVNGSEYDAPDTAQGYDDIEDAGMLGDGEPVRLGVTKDTVSGRQGGMYFLIGDNVNHSRDSRYFGPVSDTEILGIVKKVIN